MYLLSLPIITNGFVLFSNTWAKLGFMAMMGLICLGISGWGTLRKAHSLPELLLCAYLANAMIMFMMHSANATVRYSMKSCAHKQRLHLRPSADNLGHAVKQ